ncbi:MAG: WXG100 family type VII secretion target [Actinobacteria bacterium]|nr:WXG100 family type VII secretion target [Actinomycetota bacterium]
MSDQIWMNLEQIRSAAALIGDASAGLRSLLGRVQSAYNAYATDWKGSSKNQFDADYSELCTKINNLISMAENLSSDLSYVATKYASADAGQPPGDWNG